jgi:hypothetical protein
VDAAKAAGGMQKSTSATQKFILQSMDWLENRK